MSKEEGDWKETYVLSHEKVLELLVSFPIFGVDLKLWVVLFFLLPRMNILSLVITIQQQLGHSLFFFFHCCGSLLCSFCWKFRLRSFYIHVFLCWRWCLLFHFSWLCLGLAALYRKAPFFICVVLPSYSSHLIVFVFSAVPISATCFHLLIYRCCLLFSCN